MEKDITLKVRVFSDGSDDRYCITSSKEIALTLRNIAEKRKPVALYYGGTNEFILTTLLGVDSHGLWLEQSEDCTTNQKIANDNRLVVVGSHHNIKIQFSVRRPALVEYQSHSAFLLPLPDKLFRLQRREYFRLMAPALNTLKCVIPGTDQDSNQLRVITIMDISGGGIALTCAENDTELVPGKSYPDCRIDLPEFGTIVGTIAVKNLAVLTDAEGTSYKRAGCELQGLDNSSIVLLHRYVLHLQRAK